MDSKDLVNSNINFTDYLYCTFMVLFGSCLHFCCCCSCFKMSTWDIHLTPCHIGLERHEHESEIISHNSYKYVPSKIQGEIEVDSYTACVLCTVVEGCS